MSDEAIDQLVRRAQAGDAEAFGELFDLYQVPIYRFVASRVGRPSDAEDLTQLVFVKALEALPRYEMRGIPFGGWLFRLARNAIIDNARTRREHVDIDDLAPLADAEHGPERRAIEKDEFAAVSVAMRDLTDDQREVIALRFFAGLSPAEAAEVMGRQAGTIRGLQFRAIAAIRRNLGVEIMNGDRED